MKILINGAGRIGRTLTRLLIDTKKINSIIINDPFLNINNLEYLLKYDSSYGKLNFDIKNNKNFLTINKKKIIIIKNKSLFTKKNLKILNSVNLVVDSSGIKKNHHQAKEISSKVKGKILITHTYENADFHHIFGVTEYKKTNLAKIISCSICDAVAIGPLLKILDNNFSIKKGNIVTLHPWLSYQNLNDGISRSFAYPGEVIENFALGRASTEALIPKNTSCIKALKYFFPKIEKKIMSMSIRVPTPVVSSAIINLELDEQTNSIELSKILKSYKNKQKQKIFEINNEQIVSKDIISNPHSLIIDQRWTLINNFNCRFFIWYDNEFGYSSRVKDLILKII
tara:strand:+ start:9151 stop:10173 length:1023 start_codon:yes stop_codon:yes gene_type:complete